MIDFVLVSHKT